MVGAAGDAEPRWEMQEMQNHSGRCRTMPGAAGDAEPLWELQEMQNHAGSCRRCRTTLGDAGDAAADPEMLTGLQTLAV